MEEVQDTLETVTGDSTSLLDEGALTSTKELVQVSDPMQTLAWLLGGRTAGEGEGRRGRGQERERAGEGEGRRGEGEGRRGEGEGRRGRGQVREREDR
jgi:hypothetical protein